MILVMHILCAVFSIAFTAYSIISPTKRKLTVSYGSVAATLASGFYLVFSMGTPLLQSCVTGLIYLGVVMSGIMVAHRKLAHESIE